jgi:hypothetical protein
MNASCWIPRPIQLVIDDVGWREGWDLSAGGGPYRAGVDRLLSPDDYAAVAELGRRLGIRPQCAMVLCEWDRENACADYPTSTHAGNRWDNRPRLGPWLGESAALIRDNGAHFEFALHGVGHEHWENGMRTRAEWFGGGLHERWPASVLTGHLECFRRIMRQNGFTVGNETRLPASFVPCAFRYLWDGNDPESTGAVMAAAGVRQASTPFSCCTFVQADLLAEDGGFDHDLFVLDRGNCKIPYNVYDTVPAAPIPNSICGTHWPNLLRPDPAENGAAIGRWEVYLRSLADQPGAMLARNMAETVSQWFHWRFSTLTSEDGGWCLDLGHLPARARALGLVHPAVIKHPLSAGTIQSEDCAVLGAWKRGTWGFAAVQPDNGRTGSFRFGVEPTTNCWTEPGTCDLLDSRRLGTNQHLRLRVYGEQNVTWAGSVPEQITVTGAEARLAAVTSDGASCRLRLGGDPIRGSETDVILAGVHPA